MTYVPREFTNKILEMVDDGFLDPVDMLRSALCYMSEDDVKDLYVSMGLEEFDEEPNADMTEEEVDAAMSSFSYVGSRDHY